jgi:hypothetical protein
MNTILQNGTVDNLPVEELEGELNAYLEPAMNHLPEKRLREVAKLAVQGIIGGQSPLITQMARGVMREEDTIRPMATRLYRLMWNKRFSHREFLKGMTWLPQCHCH